MSRDVGREAGAGAERARERVSARSHRTGSLNPALDRHRPAAQKDKTLPLQDAEGDRK